jgi:tol-pal system protein YbgF
MQRQTSQKMLPAMIRTVPVVVVALLCALWSDAARAQMSDADLVTRMDRLEGAIRDLTGQVEQLQYRNQQLTQQLQQMQQQMQAGAPPPPPQATPPLPPQPQRPTAQYIPQPLPPPGPPPAISSAPPGPIEQAAPMPPPAPPPAPGRRSDAFDPTRNPGAPGSPRQLGTSTAANEPPPPVSDGPPPGGPGQPGAPLDLSIVSTPPGAGPRGGDLPPPPPVNPSGTGAVAALPPANTPKDEYDLGFGYIQRKDYANAAETFSDFLHKYPSDRLAPEAQFWLGEALFQSQRYRDAAEAFLAVSTKYENSARAPDALLRLGMALQALGEKEAACASLGEVLRKYPRAPQNVKQGVDREQKRAHC